MKNSIYNLANSSSGLITSDFSLNLCSSSFVFLIPSLLSSPSSCPHFSLSSLLTCHYSSFVLFSFFLSLLTTSLFLPLPHHLPFSSSIPWYPVPYCLSSLFLSWTLFFLHRCTSLLLSSPPADRWCSARGPQQHCWRRWALMCERTRADSWLASWHLLIGLSPADTSRWPVGKG